MHSYNHVLPTPEDVSAARSYLKWSQEELAKRASLGKKTLTYLENRKTKPTKEVLEKIQQVFLNEGIIFQPAGGFLANQKIIRVYDGHEGVRAFFDDVYNTMKDCGEVICVSGVDEEDFVNARNNAGIDTDEYRKKMRSLKGVSYKEIISPNADKRFFASRIEYRAMQEEDFVSNVPFYIYGNKVALILWDAGPQIIVHQNDALVEAFRTQFRFIWQKAIPVTL
ncbi:MAG: helix-turn-helix transcriptional regulator [Alphaproteobacteria bacterium]|nr:helix-turn-helix transcriptional regulator [Alphaproteobacteria bacterium]